MFDSNGTDLLKYFLFFRVTLEVSLWWFFKGNLYVAQGRNYGATSVDRTLYTVVIVLAIQASQPLHPDDLARGVFMM